VTFDPLLCLLVVCSSDTVCDLFLSFTRPSKGRVALGVINVDCILCSVG